jgi:serine/threonine protein kinase
MPAPTTVPEFLDLVRRSGLVPDSRLDEVLDRYRNNGDLPQTIEQMASLLVREAVLTFFQAKQLKLGRYKRFTIGTKYRLLELIGAGGMGAVYLCEHTLMRRLVALKVLPVEKLEDKSNEERFYREARAVAALDHPNIVRAYDIDHYEKLHFIVMEYVDGTSLQEIVARYALEKKFFDPVRAAHYIAQAAAGMQHGHELGMVHRDIKPGNLLLDRTGVIKVLDMGLARFFNKQQDSVTEKYDDKCVLGTADYLAPEQAVSNIVDIRADIYALGGTLYFLLTGQTPFPDGSIAAKLVAHQTREPRPVESFRPDVPPGIISVLRKMMAKDPAARFQEPIEVAEALAEWADQPIDPPPAREMPIHCPAVQALINPNVATTAPGSPLARTLFGAGRGIFARVGSGSSVSSLQTRSVSPTSTKAPVSGTAVPPAETGSPTGTAYPRDSVPVNGPVSTSRANTAPTTPISRHELGLLAPAHDAPTAPGSGSGFGTASGPLPATSRSGLFFLIGLLVALLLVAGGVAAYLLGRKDAPNTVPPQAAPPAAPPGSLGQKNQSPVIPRPTRDEPALTPAQAATLEVQSLVTVEFVVKSGGGRTIAHLNSEKNFDSPTNFSVNIMPVAYKETGKSIDEFIEGYKEKKIRVRGRLTRDPKLGTAGIDVTSLDQLLVMDR